MRIVYFLPFSKEIQNIIFEYIYLNSVYKIQKNIKNYLKFKIRMVHNLLYLNYNCKTNQNILSHKLIININPQTYYAIKLCTKYLTGNEKYLNFILIRIKEVIEALNNNNNNNNNNKLEIAIKNNIIKSLKKIINKKKIENSNLINKNIKNILFKIYN